MVKHVKNRSQLRDVVNMGQNLSKVKMYVHFCRYVLRKYYDFLSNIERCPVLHIHMTSRCRQLVMGP